MRLVAALRSRLASERGFTLIELVVSVAIGMVIVLAIAALMDSAEGQTTRITSRVDGTQRGRSAMEQIVQRLRSQVCLGSATPVISAQATEVTFYADFGDEAFTPEKRRFYVSGDLLKEDMWVGSGTPPNVTFATTPTQTRTVATGIDQAKDGAGSALPYFTYYAYNAATPTEPSEELAAPLTSDDLTRLVRLQVAFRTRVPHQDERVDTTFVNSVTVRMANPSDPEQDKRGPQCNF